VGSYLFHPFNFFAMNHVGLFEGIGGYAYWNNIGYWDFFSVSAIPEALQ